MDPTLIINARIILPDNILNRASLRIENTVIADFGPHIEPRPGDRILDAQGAYLIPGLVDLHTDSLEKEITPRHGADFPIEVAQQELDQKLLACGITTVFHALSLGYEKKDHGERYSRETLFRETFRFSQNRAFTKTRLHLRYEIVGKHELEIVHALMDEKHVDLLSFMDHTPGQGQYTAERFITQATKSGMTEEAARAALAERQNRPRMSTEELRELADQAHENGVVVASHDDCSPQKVEAMRSIGVTLCEFPINAESARAAKSLAMDTLGGAANVLRGGSLTGNLCMLTGAETGLIDGFCSDYYPPSMLHSIFRIHARGQFTLPQAVNMMSLVPARAARIDDSCGSIAVGKDADLCLVRIDNNVPKVLATLVRGKRVYETHGLTHHVHQAPILAHITS